MIKKSNKTLFSFEVFPPKKTMSIDTVYNTLDELKDLTKGYKVDIVLPIPVGASRHPWHDGRWFLHWRHPTCCFRYSALSKEYPSIAGCPDR